MQSKNHMKSSDLPKVKHDIYVMTLDRTIVNHPIIGPISPISLMLRHARRNNQDYLDKRRPKKSHIHKEEKRKARYWQNCVTGQTGELVLNIMYAGGLIDGMTSYRAARKHHEANPAAGDDGCDIPNVPIDMKTTFLRHPDRQQPNGAPLAVRGGYKSEGHERGERYKGHAYILGLIPIGGILSHSYTTENFGFDKENLGKAIQQITIWIVGWCKESDLPGPLGQPSGSVISPRYVEVNCIEPWNTRPMDTFPWDYFKEIERERKQNK
jgi:hypothetical protein